MIVLLAVVWLVDTLASLPYKASREGLTAQKPALGRMRYVLAVELTQSFGSLADP
jgi:hypothetical protein